MAERSPATDLTVPTGRRRRRVPWTGLLSVPVLALATAVYVPAVLAFPYQARLGSTTVLSEQPIGPNMAQVLARADRLLAASPINEPGLHRQVVLTDGGWRWHVLALAGHGAFGLRRPFTSHLVFNRSDIARDRVFNGAPVANWRTLSGTIAHETTHVLIARRIGELGQVRLPLWKREGYPDYVAQESSLRPEDEARVRQTMPGTPAIAYLDARRRVGAELAHSGGSVDALLRP
jgi:hypothetical protein